MDIEQLYANEFVIKLRTESEYDADEFERLVAMLTELKSELAGRSSIDKPVALFLYTAPQMVYGVYSRLDDQDTDFARLVSDAWLRLDAISAEILAG